MKFEHNNDIKCPFGQPMEAIRTIIDIIASKTTFSTIGLPYCPINEYNGYYFFVGYDEMSLVADFDGCGIFENYKEYARYVDHLTETIYLFPIYRAWWATETKQYILPMKTTSDEQATAIHNRMVMIKPIFVGYDSEKPSYRKIIVDDFEIVGKFFQK